MKLVLSFLFLLVAFNGRTQNSGLDPSFADNGVLLRQQAVGRIISVKLQSDQKILAIGGEGRYNTNGTEDPSFLGIISSAVIKIQPDDKILGGGQNYLSRQNADGTIDSGFGNNGSVNYFNGLGNILTRAILVQPDHKIIMVGTGTGYSSDSLIGTQEAVILIRYHPDGRIDSSFGENGMVADAANTFHYSFDAEGAALQPDGKIVVGISESMLGGSAFTASRYMPDGRLDTAFGEGGYARVEGLSLLNTMALQPDGRIALAGTSYAALGDPLGTPFILVRFLADGSPDTGLGANGVRLYHWQDGGDANKCWAMTELPDNRLLLGGRAWNNATQKYDLALLRLLPDGNPDPGFGTGGYLRTKIRNGTDEIESLVLQADGKILTAGASDCEGASCPTPILVRYMPDGRTSITTPEAKGSAFRLYPNPAKDKVFIESSTKLQHTLLFDMAGRLLMRYDGGSRELNLQPLKAGIYILSVTDAGGNTERFKIVKQ